MNYTFLPSPLQYIIKQRWVLPVVSILLLLAILATLWNTLNGLWLSTSDTTVVTFRAPNISNVQQLPQYHVLGVSANMSDLPLASLGITLKGIFYDGQNRATAVIGQNNNETTNYHDGDQLAPNITIVQILPTSAIIRHNGNLEKLAMPIQPIQFSQTNSNQGLWSNN